MRREAGYGYRRVACWLKRKKGLQVDPKRVLRVLRERELRPVIQVGKEDEGFDVSPDSREIWTANAQDGTLSIINLSARRVTATLDAKIFGANRLKFTPDGKFVFVSALGGGDLVLYEAASRKEFK